MIEAREEQRSSPNAMREALEELRHAFSNAGEPCSDIAAGPWADYVVLMIDAALSEGEWQPIETAPKDGTAILVAVAGDEYEPASVVWVAAFENWFYPTTTRHLTVDPTHWMHLPSPPRANAVLTSALEND